MQLSIPSSTPSTYSRIRHPVISITCHIDGTPYTLNPTSKSPGSRSFTLTNNTSGAYYIITFPQGSNLFTCTCPDHTERHTLCKHISCIQRLFSAILTSIQQPQEDPLP